MNDSLKKNLEEKVGALERELYQQRFNNEHNLSIDQKVSDEIKRLNEVVETQDSTIRSYKFQSKSHYDMLNKRLQEANHYKETLKNIKHLTNDRMVHHAVDDALRERIFSPEIGDEKFLNLGELKELIDSTLEQRPHLKGAEVIIDTEARRYHCHMVPAKGFWAEDDEHMLMMSDKPYVSITLDTSYTTY